MPAATDIIARFPKTRPPLSDAHARVYGAEYLLNREGQAAMEGLAKRLEAWMHRRVAALAGRGATLELGAGTLNHLAFEPPQPEYDVVEPFAELFADSPRLKQIRNVYARLSEVPPASRYGRIISIAVLEHMTELPVELAQAARLLAPGGVLQAGIPSEGGLLWLLGWRCTTGVSYWLRNRLDYGVMMRHEHVNNAAEIMALVRHLLRDVRLARFPLPLHHFSLYGYIEARDPDLAVADSLLRQSG